MLLSSTNLRLNSGTLPKVIELPDLLQAQKKAYERFMQLQVKRRNPKVGLEKVLRSIFPVHNSNGKARLELIRTKLGEPAYTVEQCRRHGGTYSVPLEIVVRMVMESRESGGVPRVAEAPVYLCELPLMTDQGTFIVSGIERVVVMQMQRSPGVAYRTEDRVSGTGSKTNYIARVNPYRGTWLDFEIQHNDQLQVRIDRKKKINGTTFLQALSDDVDRQEIVNRFYSKDGVKIVYPKTSTGKYKLTLSIDRKNLVDLTFPFPFTTKEGREIAHENLMVSEDRKDAIITHKLDKQTVEFDIPSELLGLDDMSENLIEHLEKTLDHPAWMLLNSLRAARDINDVETAEILVHGGSPVLPVLGTLLQREMKNLQVLSVGQVHSEPYILNTLQKDGAHSRKEALSELYKVLRPGEMFTKEQARRTLDDLLFNSSNYYLSPVGRMKLNRRLGRKRTTGEDTLSVEDIFDAVRELVKVRTGRSNTDDIDNLDSRRIRLVDEMIENQVRVGLARIERAVSERLSQAYQDEKLGPTDIVSGSPIKTALNEAFSSGHLSQFMDQCNPLAEVAHKRRISALGVGGINRERASYDVRDVHPSHYGRICPVESPEGPNIGLVNALATHARVDDYGFIETPLRRVVDGVVQEEVVWLSAVDGHQAVIAQASIRLSDNNEILDDIVPCRVGDEFTYREAKDVQYTDVSAQQIISVGASLIPFLEHNDGNRALMGSNMQRQAVPSLFADAPLVGTGMERSVADTSGTSVLAQRAGWVDAVSAKRIVIRPDVSASKASDDNKGQHNVRPDIFRLENYRRTNQGTVLNQRPVVQVGDYVKPGDLLADGGSTQRGDLALGQNIRVAFMMWDGYNFEDSVLVSERVVRDDRFTSVHIQRFNCTARETPNGKEEITSDIPNVRTELLSKLDEGGVVHLGAEVGPGDYLVGRVSPKGEVDMTPEDRLLRAVFGDKAGNTRDTSLRVPSGTRGEVVHIDVFARDWKNADGEIDEHIKSIRDKDLEQLRNDHNDEFDIVLSATAAHLEEMCAGHLVDSAPSPSSKDGLAKGSELPANYWYDLSWRQWIKVRMQDEQLDDAIKVQYDTVRDYFNMLEKRSKRAEEGMIKGDDHLQAEKIKEVRVYIAIKRNIQPGDKVAGRHGNKGVISMIRPIEDMPYDQFGEPVDVVLNPLGVPSRMNLGQLFETHLGWAAIELGKKIGRMIDGSASVQDLRSFVAEIYGDKLPEALRQDDDDAFLAAAQYLRRGVPMATPAYDGIKEDEIKRLLSLADLPETGQTELYDGRTGEKFDNPVTVGNMYIIKLNHLVEEKMHARATGSYSLITQQPLGGKAQYGGQRLGEMEVWALEAYGAAYALREILTVKSDDVQGRSRMYEDIYMGEAEMRPHPPESFQVLLREVRALGIDLRRETSDGEVVESGDKR